MIRSILTFVCLAVPLAPVAAQDWQPVTESLILAEKPGFGKLCGVIVDHATGDLIINLSDKGLYRSTDAGKTWQKLGTPFKGRTETPGCIMLDPTGGKRLVAALVYGASILVSPDRGETWKALDKKSTHVDWCAVDWSDPDLKWIYTLKHESGDLLLVSRDGGKSFEDVGKGYGPAWIFDNQTAVIAEAKSKTKTKPGLLRTTDGGKTFQPSAEYFAKALPRWHKDALYWLVDGALIKTTDQGKTWTKFSALKGGIFGPIFGKSEKHLFVLAQNGILESTDGGTSWQKAIPVAKDMKSVANLSWMEYDPTRDTLYVMKMGSELYRWQRKESRMSNYLFVYGTLKRRSRHPMARRLAQAAHHVGAATIAGRLYNLGRFPGLKEPRSADDWVHGDVYDLGANAESVMREMDAYENAESPPPTPYERLPANVTLDDGRTLTVWVYWYRGRVEEANFIASGSYEENCDPDF